MNAPAHTNDLIRESSPYLLQHAHNPVNWLPWGEKALNRAKAENKLMVVSIGYSTCHWCHVMERESFEKEEVAEIMNSRFISVKIDREERPDLDQVYMDALHLMGRQGGWPLNCITTPEGEPIYGGTYFPRARWMEILEELAEMWRKQPETLREYGQKVREGLQPRILLPSPAEGDKPNMAAVKEGVEKWKKRFDLRNGGAVGAPKFPLPANLLFLLEYGRAVGDEEVLAHVKNTLDRMARGGIHDHIGGGFARYATDAEWKVPHFEKMLYDNAQLLELYAAAHAVFQSAEYREVAVGISAWLGREMRHPQGGYAAALDADSEGEEGKYYTWHPDLQALNPAQKEAFRQTYRTDDAALWEGRWVANRKGSFEELADKSGGSLGEWLSGYKNARAELYRIRETRVRPETDHKRICSWNAMLAKGFIASARYGCNENDAEAAAEILRFVETRCFDAEKGRLKHTEKEGDSVDFLEDYAFVIEAYIALYGLNFDEGHLLRARELTFLALDRFYDERRGVFPTAPHGADDLIARTVDLLDDVIPSANAVMAENLLNLSVYFGSSHFEEIALRMIHTLSGAFREHPDSHARWGALCLRLALGSPELVIAGPEAREYSRAVQALFMPSVVRAAATENSRLAPLENRLGRESTQLYICRHRACGPPANSVSEAMQALGTLYDAL